MRVSANIMSGSTGINSILSLYVICSISVPILAELLRFEDYFRSLVMNNVIDDLKIFMQRLRYSF